MWHFLRPNCVVSLLILVPSPPNSISGECCGHSLLNHCRHMELQILMSGVRFLDMTR